EAKPTEPPKPAESRKTPDTTPPPAPAPTPIPVQASAPAPAPAPAQEPPPPSEPPMPSAPKDLAPKAKTPDLDMTFYRELPKRKVIVPLEEFADNRVPGKTQAAAPAAQQPQEKPNVGTGKYMAQLGVFGNAQNASAMVSDLQKKGVPARMVKSGNAYRVRVGPFPSHADAARALMQWHLGGFNTLIFQDNE
ncbi:MAG: SPOR domain-containing protein, partial [Magnetococcales bacterium]|nr:SPOR domain-containing protein [Magnetococcales bacterium]